MTENHSFIVNDYIQPIEWSHDWSRTPNGNYYSNKAPGPALIGFPLYWSIDQVFNHGATKEERNAFRYKHVQLYMWALAFFFQLIPFSLLAVWLARYLPKQGLGYYETQAVIATVLFGNTAAFFMANWGGHAITALFTLGLGAAIYFKRPILAGLCFGFSLLSDYGSAMLLIPAVIALAMNSEKKILSIGKFAIGGIVPGTLWVWYHTACFGGPFHIANEFQNPMFLDMTSEDHNIWGILVPFPKWEPMWQLLIGDKRGFIKTQAWVLVFLAWIFSKRYLWKSQSQELRSLTVFSLTGLFALYYMNCCFGSWDGGTSPGPRYMSAIFPILAVTAALWLPLVTDKWKKAFAYSLLPSFFYFIIFYPMRMGLFGGYFNLEFNSTLWGQIVEVV